MKHSLFFIFCLMAILAACAQKTTLPPTATAVPPTATAVPTAAKSIPPKKTFSVCMCAAIVNVPIKPDKMGPY